MSHKKLNRTALSIAITSVLVISGCKYDFINKVTKDDAYYKAKAEQMLSSLSLDEKLDIVSGPGMDMTTYEGEEPLNLEAGKDVSGVAGYINGVANNKIDIPAIKLSDGPAGLRINPEREGDSNTYYATAWPVGSLLASTWDTKLVKEVGEAFGDEVKEYGVDFILAPGMNIQRNPLLGRNFEYYSEDPVVAGNISAAMVNGIQSNGVGATIKHFFANNAETNRFFNDSIAEPRTLREIYLRGFQIAVEQAQPWALMTSYNLANGTYVNQREDAVTDILRNEWGFKGLVMSDWFAGNVSGLASDFTTYGTRDEEAAAKMIKAGNDLIQPGGVKADLQASIANGTLTEEDVDKSVVNILTQVQKTPSYQNYNYSDHPDLSAHADLSRNAAAQGMVLLKNTDSALPLRHGVRVASFGTTQINTLKGGTGSGDVNASHIQSIVSGLEEKFTVDTALTDYYDRYFEENKTSNDALVGGYEFSEEPPVEGNTELQNLIASAAESDDSAIITIGRQAGEGDDRYNEKGDYLLTDKEQAIITAVSNAFHAQGKSVTVVLNINGIIDTTSWSDKVDSILLAYMGGQEMGGAVADILSGDVNPSGKLAQTIPAHYTDVPSASTFPGEDIDGDGLADLSHYNEGIYVGYRYYTSFDVDVAYPFGYGMSYTNFDYSNVMVTSNTLNSRSQDKDISLSVMVRNSGDVAGKEVVEVYVSAPEVKLDKPAIELKAFDKTDLLAAGGRERLNFKISAETLASFDQDRNEWIVEPGAYTAYIAHSSDVSDAIPVTFTVRKEIVVSHTTPGALALPNTETAGQFTTVTK